MALGHFGDAAAVARVAPVARSDSAGRVFPLEAPLRHMDKNRLQSSALGPFQPLETAHIVVIGSAHGRSLDS